MIRKLRHRPRSDNQVNQARRRGGRWARRVYLAMVAALLVAISDYAWGDMVFLRADGVVVRDRVTVASTSRVRIEAVHVRGGQNVAAGDPLVQVESTEILNRIADLTLRHAELAQREAELHARLNKATALRPLAESHAAEMSEGIVRLRAGVSSGIVTGERYEDAMREHFDAQRRFADLTVDADALDAGIAALAEARLIAAEALDDLVSHYSEGETVATVPGAVGSDVPEVGEVYGAGAPLLSIHTGEPYVLAYLPATYLFTIEEGMSVRISDGRNAANGRIAEILPISKTLPAEFRTAFQPGDTRQLARITFDGAQPFPARASVRITAETPMPELLRSLQARYEDAVSGLKPS